MSNDIQRFFVGPLLYLMIACGLFGAVYPGSYSWRVATVLLLASFLASVAAIFMVNSRGAHASKGKRWAMLSLFTLNALCLFYYLTLHALGDKFATEWPQLMFGQSSAEMMDLVREPFLWLGLIILVVWAKFGRTNPIGYEARARHTGLDS